MNKRVTSVMAQLSVLSAMCGDPFMLCNHSHDHEYRDKVKTHYKGMSAEEMGTSHKRKSRRYRKGGDIK